MVRYLISLLGEKKFEVDRDGNSCLTLAILNQKDDMIAYLIYEGGFNTEQWQQVSTPSGSVYLGSPARVHQTKP